MSRQLRNGWFFYILHNYSLKPIYYENTFAFRLLVFFAFILFYSCIEETVSPLENTHHNAASLMKKVREDDQTAWNDFLTQSANATENAHHSSADISDRSLTSYCNCAFRMVDVQIQTPPEHPDYEINFFSSAECQPGNPFCYYYSSWYFSGPVCGQINNPACFDDWTGLPLPPQGDRHFHCKVPEFSKFPVTAGVIWVDNSCNGGDGVSWSITFRVVCQNDEMDACDPLGHGYVSPPYTLSGSGSNYFQTMGIQLTECGCVPQLARW